MAFMVAVVMLVVVHRKEMEARMEEVYMERRMSQMLNIFFPVINVNIVVKEKPDFPKEYRFYGRNGWREQRNSWRQRDA